MLDIATKDAFLDDLNAAVWTACNMPRVRFEVGLGDDVDIWIRKKHADGAVHEPATIAAFLAVAKHYDCRNIFDVGALFGYFSLLSLMLFENAEVTAFEMHPGAMPALHRNVAPSVACVQAVISDECKASELFWISGFNIFEKPDDGWEALANDPGAMKQRGENNRGSGFANADFTTIDAYCETNKAPDLIKMDVEGFQAKAILGALNTIRDHKPVIILELHDPEKIERFATTNAKTVQPLLDLGYRSYWCGDHRSPEAKFEVVERMEEKHEKLSLMVFVP